MAQLQSLIPCLWFDNQAEDAARFYTNIFDNSRINRIARYSEAGQDVHQRAPGSVMTIEFELNGHPFTALNGGPLFRFSPAISFQLMCESQHEIDHFWNALGEGGDETARQCGWLQDKFGVSWQVVPALLPSMMTDADPAKVARVTVAMMAMKKLDIAALQRAYAG